MSVVPSRSIGVVIRTLDESALIGRCLDTLRAQNGGFHLDVVVVDSGSRDGTVEIAHSHGARVLELSPAEFDYSKALNLGIEHVRGELVVSLSAHAIPVDEHMLERISAPFRDPTVAGVSARQLPWPDAPWQEVNRLQHQFARTPQVFSAENEPILFSNAASCIRRATWSAEPFTLPAVEDLDWARRVVAAGWTIVYEPEAAVYHSHFEDARAQAHRLIDLSRVKDAENRPRTLRRTVREGVGLVVREARVIRSLDEPFRRKLAYLLETVQVGRYYVLEFSREGTTAERRRNDSSNGSSTSMSR